jgi:predicted enzyme related to lactoylglutathione lyase
MTLNVDMVTFDCGDPARLAGWWAEQFGGTTHVILADEFTAVTFPEGLRLGFQKVPDVDAVVARLTAAGASEVGRHTFGDTFRWVVLADPEGNVFCIVRQ